MSIPPCYTQPILIMDKFFSFLGKFFVAVGIIGVLIGTGYYLGIKFGKTSMVKPIPTHTMSVSVSPVSVMNITATPTASTPSQATGRFGVKAGGIKPFSAYTLSGVSGWSLTKAEDNTMSKVVLTKGNYSVTILQGAFGVGPCVFPGDQPQPMGIQLTSSTDIQLFSGNPLRRGQTQSSSNQASFTVCQKTNGSYSTFTDFGAINYTTPTSPDSSVLAEIDAMVGSLQKQ